MGLELPPQVKIRRTGFRKDHHAARVLVEPVDNARTLHRADAGHFRTTPHKLFGDRAVLMPRRGMDDPSRRLVDDDDVSVLEDDLE